MTILITGGAGYIGSKVNHDLIKLGYKTVVIDNLSTGDKRLINKTSTFYNIDITNKEKLSQIFKKHKFKTIFHFAAATNVVESGLQPEKYYINNVIGTENILEELAKNKIKFFILSSTAAVYGDSKKVSFKENSELTPRNNYGKTKLFSEILTMNYAKLYKFKYVILRYFNVVGADEDLRSGQIAKGSLFKTLANNICNKKFCINIYGSNFHTKDRTALRDYIDVNDLSAIHILSFNKIKKNKSFIMNCGYNKPWSVKEIVKNFESCINRKINIKYLNKRQGEAGAIYANNTFLKKQFPSWRQNKNLKDSINLSILWEKRVNKY
jgi:UDP-glucose 4-epimerase